MGASDKPLPPVPEEGDEPGVLEANLDRASMSQILNMQEQLSRIFRERYEQHMAVLFSDIAGSTAYFERHGDLAGRAMIERHNGLLVPIIERHGGRLVKTIGDALLATFPVVAAAALAATAMQRMLKEANRVLPPEEGIRIRIGIHYGTVLMNDRDGDVYGDTVNVAARVQSKAEPEQILLSEPVRDQLPPDLISLELGRFTFKGKSGEFLLYELPWEDPGVVAPLRGRKRKGAAAAALLVAALSLVAWRVVSSSREALPPVDPVRQELRELERLLRQGPLMGTEGKPGAFERLDRARLQHGERPELTAFTAQLAAGLAAAGRAALEERRFREALPLLEKAAVLVPGDRAVEETLARARVLEDALAGMVDVGGLFIDRYEYPNRKGEAPRTQVDWEEAGGLCAGQGKRLCDEAEWERACRGSLDHPFPYGVRFDPNRCRTGASAPLASGAMPLCATSEGVADLSGNVAEWTASPIAPGSPQRVVRGGRWDSQGSGASCGARDYFLPGVGGSKRIGFRCCL